MKTVEIKAFIEIIDNKVKFDLGLNGYNELNEIERIAFLVGISESIENLLNENMEGLKNEKN